VYHTSLNKSLRTILFTIYKGTIKSCNSCSRAAWTNEYSQCLCEGDHYPHSFHHWKTEIYSKWQLVMVKNDSKKTLWTGRSRRLELQSIPYLLYFRDNNKIRGKKILLDVSFQWKFRCTNKKSKCHWNVLLSSEEPHWWLLSCTWQELTHIRQGLCSLTWIYSFMQTLDLTPKPSQWSS